MDTPRIQYAKTEDGVSIAYWKIGAGPPLVLMPDVTTSHVQLEWSTTRRRVFELLAGRATVIRYDCRGTGMSQRDSADFSTESQVRDLVAVLDGLAIEKAAICAIGFQSAPGLLFASTYPGRVSHVILHFGVGPGQSRSGFGRFGEIMEPLIDHDFHMYNQVMARVVLGWDSPDATAYAQLRDRSLTPSVAHAWTHAPPQDPQVFGDGVTVPTLVLYRGSSDAAEARASRAAALFPGSHLLAVPGEWAFSYPGAAGLEAILDFINTPSLSATARPPVIDANAFRAVLFTDLEAHTAMMQRLGDAKGREVLREHERISREALRAHGGTEVKTIGDSFMASFPSAQKAVECAIALQRAFAATECAGERLRIRVGINAGEPIADEDDLFGASVILASRTKEKASGGEIFVTDVVRQLVAGKGFASRTGARWR
jgi:pimeloyl-ACP methyl ester carboxylesterase